MFELRRRFLLVAVAGILLVAVTPDQGKSAEDRDAALQESQQQHTQIAEVAANSDAFIAALVEQWKPAVIALNYPAAAWEQEFIAALGTATPEQLLAIKGAANYDAVRAILQGRSAPVNVSGLNIQDLGDLTNDLTFTPLFPPCRYFDTRNQAGGLPQPAVTVRSYQVYGNAATINAQGGNPAGCGSPKGEPVAIATNITAIPQGVAGHLRVYPFGVPLPTVSFLNYGTGLPNVANAGIISTCYLCAADVSVYTSAASHNLGDSMGFFYPAQTGLAFETRHGGYDNCCGDGSGQDLITGAPEFVGSFFGNTTLTVNAGDEVLIQFSAMVFYQPDIELQTNAIAGTVYPAYRDIVSGAVTYLSSFENQTDFCFDMLSSAVAPVGGLRNFWWLAGDSRTPTDMRPIMGSGRAIMPTSGTYEFGIGAQTGADGCSGWTWPYWITSKKISVIKIRRP